MIKSFGGSVIVTCGTDEKCAAAKEIGADHAVNYNAQDFTVAVQSFTNGAGVDLVLDMVGGNYIRRNLCILKYGGQHVSIAFLNGAKGEIIIPTLMQKNLTLTGSVLRSRPTAEKVVLIQDLLKHVWPKIERGEIKPQIDKVFDLKDVADAHRRMERGKHIGKIVLRI